MAEPQSRKLLWSQNFETFDTHTLDANTWNFDLGDGSQFGLTGWGNHEREYYLRESVQINSDLIISAERLNDDSGLNCYYGAAEWKSGKIHTAGKVEFKYGLIEVVAKVPSGIGVWPAIWMLGSKLNHGTKWPECGEIDILENTGAKPHQVQGTIHGPRYSGEDGLTKIISSISPLSDDYHKFSILWKPGYIEWFFDDESYNIITRENVEADGKTWPFDSKFYLVLNLAIGGWFAGDVDPELSKAEFRIKSIEHYAVNEIGELFLN